jgi:mannose-6-phosphate isomerase
MLYPLTFQPRFKERVWGGRALERLYHKTLPFGIPIGESWEISDRPGDVSVIANGPLAGKDLRWLMEHHSAELLGSAKANGGRFPLLIKILDAREKLSLQVHPPPAKAAELAGEPKTEMWYIADAAPDAELYVGLKRGVTRDEFRRKLQDGSVADCFHRVRVRAGDAMFLPSGRVHAIGAGLVLFEIQQNSDTTYRVFDWNRVGLDGKPRDLHIPQSLASIDFEDFEPSLAQSPWTSSGSLKKCRLVSDPLFKVDVFSANNSGALGITLKFAPGEMKIIGVISGRLAFADGTAPFEAGAGQFCLIPASVLSAELRSKPGTTFLMATAGNGQS